MHVNDIGPYFAAWPRYPFLNTGYTTACFSIAEISLVCNDLWNNCISAGASYFASDNRIRQGMPYAASTFRAVRFHRAL